MQSVIDAAGPGASLCFEPGTYRLTASLRPQSGQVLTFERGAVLSGAKVVTGWTKQGSYWVLGGQTQEFSSTTTYPWLAAFRCDNNPAACIYEDLFRDDVPLVQVLALTDLGPGKVYFDKNADKMYIVDDPTGHKMEATVLTTGISSASSGVTIRGAIIEKMGWIGLKVTGSGWTIENSEFRYAHVKGLSLGEGGSDYIVRGSYFHHNGNTGLSAWRASGMLIEDNEIAYNNYLHFGAYPTPHDEGGAKFLSTSNITLRGNYSHHNDGDGWWFDTNNIDILVEDNVFEANTRSGFFYEVSYDAVIRNNLFKGNGTDPGWPNRAGLWIQTSKNVEVVGNRFEDNNYSTLFANWTDRGSGDYGEFETTNLYVHDNVFKMSRGWVGSSWGLDAIGAASSNNRFEANTYIVPDVTRKWWTWRPGGFVGWATWRSYGFDVDGLLVVE